MGILNQLIAMLRKRNQFYIVQAFRVSENSTQIKFMYFTFCFKHELIQLSFLMPYQHTKEILVRNFSFLDPKT